MAGETNGTKIAPRRHEGHEARRKWLANGHEKGKAATSRRTPKRETTIYETNPNPGSMCLGKIRATGRVGAFARGHFCETKPMFLDKRIANRRAAARPYHELRTA